MKRIIVVTVTAVAVVLSSAAIYVYMLGGVLPFGITFPGQPDIFDSHNYIAGDIEAGTLASAVMELFSSPVIIKDGEITGLGDAIPLLSSAAGLHTFAPYFPAKDFRIAGFDAGRPMTLYLDFDRNYYLAVRPTTDILFQLLGRSPPHYRTVGTEDGTMSAELLIAQDTYGYRFWFINKERINETKSESIKRGTFIQTMTDIYNGTSSELAVSKNLFDSITGGLHFKQLIHLDYGFTVDADIRSYAPQSKRIVLFPKGGLCVLDITVSRMTATNRNLLKRVGPIGAETYYLAYRQPLSGNVVIALPDGENFLYVTLSGSGDVADDELFEFLLTVLTVDYIGSLALTDY
jgi:hypothetical protein